MKIQTESSADEPDNSFIRELFMSDDEDQVRL